MAEQIGGAALFALACNLDTLILAITYGLKGLKLSWAATWVLAAVTTAVTAAALALGDAAAYIAAPFSGLLGGLTLIALGLWAVLDALRHLSAPAGEEEAQAPLTPAACVPLGAALAVNNAGAGVAAGLSGLSVLWCSLASLAFTVLALSAGRRLSALLGRSTVLARWALPLSGALLVLLGALQVLGG